MSLVCADCAICAVRAVRAVAVAVLLLPLCSVVTYTSVELEEIEECKPDGSKWKIRDQGSGLHSSIREILQPEQKENLPAMPSPGAQSRPPKSLRVLGRLNSNWPPPSTFSRNDALRRIPWFPMWWSV